MQYTWDANGNLLNDGQNTYSYDTANHLTSVTGQGVSETYVYNGQDDRLVENATHFVLDINTGLSQVLEDDTFKYLYGNERIAQMSGMESDYFLGDALGSVRQLVDSAGIITLTQSFTPYGEISGSQGSGMAIYGYTGEQQQNGLVHLRARDYESSMGRFISRDSWSGDNSNPMSYNSWIYGYSNPVGYTDPSGHVPLVNQFDLSNWFYEELKFNVNHIYTKQIHALLSSVGIYAVNDNLRGVFGWIYLVKDEAKWDFKHNIKKEFGSESFIFQHENGFDWYEYSMPGNIFYGSIGRVAGFSRELLHLGAGYAEVTDPAHVKRGESCCPKICLSAVYGSSYCIKMGCYYFNPDWAKSFFDDPLDYQAVEFGVQLYETYKENLTYQLFQTFMTSHRFMLTKGKPIPEDQWHKIAEDFYKPEHFDGPDTVKNAPIVNSLLLWPPLSKVRGL